MSTAPVAASVSEAVGAAVGAGDVGEATTHRSPKALLAAVALLMAGVGLVQSLLGVRGSAEQLDTAVLGALMSAYFAGFLCGSLWTPRLIASVGHIRVFAALGATASSTFLLHGVFLHPGAWLVLRIAGGFCVAGIVVVAESWLNAQAANRSRGRLLSSYTVVTFGALGVGQLLLNVDDPHRIGLFILVSVLVSMSVVPVALTRLPAPAATTGTPVSLRSVVAVAPVGFLGAATSGVTHSVLLSLGAVYAIGAGLSVAGVSAFTASILLGAMVLAVPMGRLSDHLDRRKVVAGGAWCAAAIAAVGALAGPDGLGTLMLIGGVLGALSFPMYSISLAHLNDRLQPGELVNAGSKLVFAYAVGAAVGPLLAAGTMSMVGGAGFWWYHAVLHGVLGTYAAYRLSHLAPIEVKGEFAPLPSSITPMIIGVLPDTADDVDSALRQIELRDVALRVHEAGTGDPVLFVHGLGANSALWHHQHRSLTRAGFATMAYDLRGHGGSTAAPTYRLDDHIGDLRNVIAALGPSPIHLVSAGFGALVALGAAGSCPGQVRSLTLVSFTGWISPRDVAGRLERQGALVVDRMATRVLGARFMASRIAAASYDPHHHPDRYRLLRDAILATAPDAVWQARYDALEWTPPPLPPDLPVLVILGANDPAATGADRAILQELAGPAGVASVAHAGRFPQLDNPHEVNRLLAGFIGATTATEEGVAAERHA